MDHQDVEYYWHAGDSLQQSLLAFHDNHAAFPKKAISAAQHHHADIMKDIHRDLKEQGVALRFEFTGSSAEGIKVPSTDLEFDVMVILPGGQDVIVNKIKPLFARISLGKKCEPLVTIADPSSQFLMPKKAREFFHSKLQRAINAYPALEKIIKLSEHGPAVQMNVYKTPGKKIKANLFYKVDMVPCIHSSRGKYADHFYVGKPIEELAPGGWTGNPAIAWRRSFSLHERCSIRKIDAADECHKHCVRMLKVLRDKETGLCHISSYIIKSTILSMVRGDNLLDWKMWNLGRRFMDVLKYLAGALEEGSLQHYFVPKVNLLEGLSFAHMSNMELRLKELLRSEHCFYKLLDSVGIQGAVQGF